MIVGALLCRNEAASDRYLRRAAENALQFCDALLCLDDGSTDDTPAILRTLPRTTVLTESSAGFWGQNETRPRARLWQAACEAAGPGGWIYVLDADHELCGLTPDDFRMLARADTVTAWAWPLLDCWESDTLHRVDSWWQAWRSPRPWMAKVPPPEFVPQWPTRGIHVGHFPANLPLLAGVAPGYIRHLGYIQRVHREAKAQRYLALA